MGTAPWSWPHAAADPVDQYGTLALLTFQCTEAAVDGTELTVTATERDGQAVEDTAVIPVELPHACYAKDFLDVDLGQWYHEPIDFVVSQGLMKGMGENRFQPNTSMTRGQLVTVLYRLAGEPAVEGTSPFDDVQAGRLIPMPSPGLMAMRSLRASPTAGSCPVAL